MVRLKNNPLLTNRLASHAYKKNNFYLTVL